MNTPTITPAEPTLRELAETRPVVFLARPEMQSVISAMRKRMPPEAIACWCISEHAALGGRAPIDMLDRDRAAVIRAAIEAH